MSPAILHACTHTLLYYSFLKMEFFFMRLIFYQIRIQLPTQFYFKTHLNRTIVLHKRLLRVQQLLLISRLTSENKTLLTLTKSLPVH